MTTSFTHRKVALSVLALLGAASFDALAAARGVVHCSGYAGSTQAGGIDTANQFGVLSVSMFNPHATRQVDIDRIRVRKADGTTAETIIDSAVPPLPRFGSTVLAPTQSGAFAATPGPVSIQVNWSQSASNRTEPVFKAVNALYDAAGVYLGSSITDCHQP